MPPLPAGKNPAEDAPPVDFTVPGTPINIFFGVCSALGTIAFAFGDTLLPEIQATLKEPVKSGMYKSVHLCYSVIASSYIMVTVSGYWAFGNGVAPYLVNRCDI